MKRGNLGEMVMPLRSMNQKISRALTRIEDRKNVDIISVREAGSRLYGVSHEGSDHDIRLVYTFDEAWKYPSFNISRKTIDYKLGELEFHGWNIDKFGEMVVDSNPSAIEFLQADAHEELHPGEWRKIEKNTTENFNHMSLYHHYISLAKNNYKQYVENGNDRTKGRQFYIARAIACAKYIRITGKIPPIQTDELIQVIEADVSMVLRRLARAKRKGHGPDETPDIVGELYERESDAQMEVTEERTRSPDHISINDLIRAHYTQSEDL